MEIKGFTEVKNKPSYVKMLLYGEMGAGKTRFCADAPNPVWFDFEDSTETLRHWPEPYCSIPVKRPRDVEEMKLDVNKILASKEADTIVIDSITTSLDYFLRAQVAKEIAAPTYSGQNRKGGDPNILYEADYKYATQVFKGILGFLQLAPINVVLIGHHFVLRDNDGKVEGIYPDVTPRIRAAVTQLINVVAYMEALPSSRGMKRRLYLNKTSIIEAKNRLNIQEQYMEDPEWKKVFE